MLERKELVEKEVLRSRLIRKLELRKETKQHSTGSVGSVVHPVASETQRQSGSPSILAAAVASGAAANVCGLVKMCDGIFDGSLLMIKDAQLTWKRRSGDDHLP